MGMIGMLCVSIATLGCRSAAIYHGVVLDAASDIPVSGIEVRGHYLIDAKFAPSLDGLFTRHSKAISATTDSNGTFTISLAGYCRSLAVYHATYETAKIPLNAFPTEKEIIIRLHRQKGTQ